MKRYTYRVHLEPEPEGGFTATVPSLPGCVSWGEDVDHALVMIQEAIEGYLEVLVDEGKPIPEESLTGSVDTIIQVVSPAVA